MKFFIPFYVCCVIFCLLIGLRPSLAQEPVLVGKVVSGEQGYELPVQVENLNNEQLTGVKVDIIDKPQDLKNFKVIAPGKVNLAPGKTAVYIVRFDVAEDAAAQEFAVISLSISADNGEFENPSPQIAVTVMEQADKEEKETSATTQGGISDNEEPDDKTEKTGPYVYVLTKVAVESSNFSSGSQVWQIEHNNGELGYVQKYHDTVSKMIELTRCIDCPTEITLGRTIHFKVNKRSRYDSDKYQCWPKESRDQWPPYIGFSFGFSSSFFEAGAKGKALHFPSCQELGVVERELSYGGKPVLGTTYDPVPWTQEEQVTLAADIRFTGDATDKDDFYYNDPTFAYLATYTTDGKLSKEVKEGEITVEYDNRFLKTPEFLMDNRLILSAGGLILTYTLQVAGEPKPIAVAKVAVPAEFDAPRLGVVNVAVAEKESGKGDDITSESDSVDSKETGSDGRIVPDFVGLKAKAVRKKLQADGYKVKLQAGKAAATPEQVFTVAKMEPKPGSQLATGETIVITVFTSAKKKAAPVDPLPDLLGKKAKVAKQELMDKGYHVKIQAGEPAPALQQAFTVKSMNPAPGTHLEKGEEVVLIVFVKAKKLIQLPDVVGISNLAAKKRLARLGLKSTVTLQGNAPSVEKSFQVFRTKPPAKIKVAAGSTVAIVAWGSFKQGNITIPNVLGIPVNEATQIFRDIGLTVETSRGKHAPRKALEGRISAQTPEAGNQLAPHSEVELHYYTSYVWSGPAPNLKGLTLKQALHKLNEKELEMDVARKRPQAPSIDKVGRVVSQSPGAGSNVRENDKITVIVYGRTRQELVADHNCTKLPNTEAFWDSASKSPRCRCKSGYIVRADKRGCNSEPVVIQKKPAVTKRVPLPAAVEKTPYWPGIRGLWRKDDGIEVIFKDEFNGYYEKVLFLSEWYFTKGELGYRVTKTGPDTYDIEVKWRWNNLHRKPYWKNSDLKIKDKNTMIEGGTMVWHRVNAYR